MLFFFFFFFLCSWNTHSFPSEGFILFLLANYTLIVNIVKKPFLAMFLDCCLCVDKPNACNVLKNLAHCLIRRNLQLRSLRNLDWAWLVCEMWRCVFPVFYIGFSTRCRLIWRFCNSYVARKKYNTFRRGWKWRLWGI